MSHLTRLGLLALLAGVAVLSQAAPAPAPAPKQPLFQVDGTILVTFYDLPSRRFRSVRDAFIRREFEQAGNDLSVSAGFLQVELARTPESLKAALQEVVQALQDLAQTLGSADVAVQDLDPLFARAHWLLAQHYLALGVAARDARDYETTGWLLVACAHHMERTALWSNARITRPIEESLVQLYDLATNLKNAPTRRWVLNNKPVVRAQKTLIALGEHLNKPVRYVMPK